MRVLMVGVDRQTKGGMWTVAENYLCSADFVENTGLVYVPTSITGSIPCRLAFTAKALLLVLKEMLTAHCDIVHVHMAERGSVYRKNLVICLAKLFRSKVVIHMHGAEFEDWYKGLTEKKQAGIRRILNKADKVLILGKYWENFVSSLMEDPEKVQVLYNAVAVPEQNTYDISAENLLFLGVVGQRKGVYDLLRAVKEAEKELSENVRLMIYGPEFEQKIDSAIKEMGLTDRVEYKGWLPPEERAGVFQKTAVNILPSYNEGLPMTILETMAAGIPNISTNVAAIPEAVTKKNGVVITPGDTASLAQAIIQLMKDREVRQSKSYEAYRSAKEVFSLENHIHQLLYIYEELSEKHA